VQDAAVTSEEDEDNSQALSSAQDVSRGDPRILPIVTDVLLTHEECRRRRPSLPNDGIRDVLATDDSVCCSAMAARDVSLPSTGGCHSISTDSSVGGCRLACCKEDFSCRTDVDRMQPTQKLLPLLCDGGETVDTVTVADVHADSLPDDKLLAMSPCGGTNVDTVAIADSLPRDKLLPSLCDGSNVDTVTVADIQAVTTDSFPHDKLLPSLLDVKNVDTVAVADSLVQDKLLLSLHDGENVDTVAAADSLPHNQDKLLPSL